MLLWFIVSWNWSSASTIDFNSNGELLRGKHFIIGTLKVQWNIDSRPTLIIFSYYLLLGLIFIYKIDF